MVESGFVAGERYDGLRARRAALVAVWCVCAASWAGPARAQAPADDPNPGALTFTGGVDVPAVYFFRGIRQERDPRATLQPYGDIRIVLGSGDGLFKWVGVSVGVAESLHTGSSGTSGPSRHAHYEEAFHAALHLGFGGALALETSYSARTSPNFMFDTIKEVRVRVARTRGLKPYGLIAVELTDQSTDGGIRKGRYAELGLGPVFPLIGRATTLTIPAKVGLSLGDYYELNGRDHPFGFFDVGGLLTVPLGLPVRFGMWNIHGGANLLVLGQTPRAANIGADGRTSRRAVVALFGAGVTY